MLRKGMAAAEDLKDLRGRGVFELNSQPCDDIQREIRDETGYAFNLNKGKTND